MGNRRVCLVCRTPFGAEDLFCFKCGAKIDSEVLDEAASIDYLLSEIKEWPTWITIPVETEKRLIDHYEDRIVRITDSIRALPPKISPPIETIQPPPPALFVETRPQPTDAVVNLSALEAVIADGDAPPPPPQITFVATISIVETKPIVATPVEVVIAPPIMETVIEEEPEAPRKSIAELVAENIKLIFAISAALFVGGILLYYRNELYLGLKQPITQAVILGFVTVSLIVAGWTLVRRTQQTLAGRTMTLVGSLLVPINPWFLVRTQLIPQSGNGWILGLACAALYGWTAYFLKEKLYVYLALATGIITGWSLVYRLTGNDATSGYAVVLMAFSIAYLLAERFVARGDEQREAETVNFGSPFFHVAQVGIALSLLFYTPLVTFVPIEFVAAKRYFDPNGYNSPSTIWLALCAAFGYFYSGLYRRYRIFVYLGITALLCAESAALYRFELAIPTAALVFVATALVMMVIARSGKASEFYAQPLSHVGILASLVMVCWSVILFTLHMLDQARGITGWRIIAAVALGGVILSADSLARKTSEAAFTAAALFAAAILFAAFKLEISYQLIPIIFLIPAYALLLAHKRTPDEDKPYPREHFHAMALVLVASIIGGSALIGETWLAHRLSLSALALGIAGALAISARKTIEQNPRIAQSYAVLLFGSISFAAFLTWTDLPIQMTRCLGMAYPFALLFAATLWSKKTVAYFGRLIGEMNVLRSAAVFFALVVTALSAASGSFTEHELTRAILMFELASFFAIAAFYTRNESGQMLQLYGSLIFGAVSFGTLLDRFGPAIAPSLCLAMIYPFGLLALAIWQKRSGSERIRNLNTESFVLRSSAIVAAGLILALSIVSGSFRTNEFVHAILAFQLGLFFAISGFNSNDQFSRIIQFYASLLFGGLSYAAGLHYSNIPLDISLCLGMCYPFAIFGASRSLKNHSATNSQKRIEAVAVMRVTAIASAIAVAGLMLLPGSIDQYGASLTILLFELAIFFGVSGFNTELSISRLVRFFAAIFFGICSFGSSLEYLHAPETVQVPLMMVVPYLMHIVSAFIRKRSSKLTGDEISSGRSLLTDKLADTKLALTGWAIIMTGYGVLYCLTFNSTLGHTLGYSIVAAEIVGLLAILGHLNSNRILGYASFLGSCLFATICLNSVMKFTGLTSLMERPFAFALMALSFYLISQHGRIRAEFRDSLSIASTAIAGCVFFRSIFSFVDFDNYRESVLPVLLIAPLIVIGVKEIIHLVRTRSILHSVFSLLIGFALVGKLLGIANVEFATVVIWIEGLSLAYLVAANFLRQSQVESEVVIPMEILSNLAMAICWVLAVTSGAPFNLRTCAVILMATVFYAIGAVQRKSEIVGRIYAHVASSLSLITVVVCLSPAGISGVSSVSTVLLPLLSIYIVAEYLLKRTVFRDSLFNIAQIVFPLLAILQFQDGLKSQSTAIESSVFFAEISLFYLLSAFQKRLSILIYPGIAALGTMIWFILHIRSIDSGYITPIYAMLGLAFLLFARNLFKREHWSADTFDNCGHITLALAGIGAATQSIVHMHLHNPALTPIIVSLLGIIAIAMTVSITERDPAVKKFYRVGAAMLAFVTYLTIGIKLGFHLTRETEFYTVPMGMLVLTSGYILARKKRDLAALWLWIGSGLLAVPLLLHALQYRFIIEQSSTGYDVALLVISLALILGGIIEHLKAPTVIGGSSFLIVMSVIVFSYVDWEQKTLSISMIVLALILFVSSWIIHSFYKRNQLGAIGRQGKQVIEEFGKWR